MGPRASISSGRPSSIRSKTSSTVSNCDEVVGSFGTDQVLTSTFSTNVPEKIQRGMEQRRSDKSVTISLKEGDEEMTKSIIQERPLPELPIKQYVLPILFYLSITAIFV